MIEMKLERTGKKTEYGYEIFLVRHGGMSTEVYRTDYSTRDSPPCFVWVYVEDCDSDRYDPLPYDVYINEQLFHDAYDDLLAREYTPQQLQSLHGSVPAPETSSLEVAPETSSLEVAPADWSVTTAITFNDEDKHTNQSGGTQTRLPVRCDLLPSDVLLRVSQVLSEGAEKYGEDNWKLIETSDHINHALTHIYRWQTGDDSEPHLVHAVCRLLFATHCEDLIETKGN